MFCLSPWKINSLRVREDDCVTITPTHISPTMFPPSAYRSPRIPGAWLEIDATGGHLLRVSSRPYSALSQFGSDARPVIFPQVSILPLPRFEAHAVLLLVDLLNTFIPIVEIPQLGEAPFGAMGSPQTRGPCLGHTLSRRRKNHRGRLHPDKENIWCIYRAIHP
jgi:hypothetical protein